jgi:hypothetical protein
MGVSCQALREVIRVRDWDIVKILELSIHVKGRDPRQGVGGVKGQREELVITTNREIEIARVTVGGIPLLRDLAGLKIDLGENIMGSVGEDSRRGIGGN